MLDSVPLGLLAGLLLSAALVGSALLGWLEDLKRSGGSISARETTRRSASRQKPNPSPPTSRAAKASGGNEQEERIRAAYFAKERKAREVRERQRRHQQARHQKPRHRTKAASGGYTRTAPPAPANHSEREAGYRATLELTGPLSKESLRFAYRRMIAAYHPDRCATLGDKLQRLAEEETKRINEAYSYFKRVLK